MSGDAVVKSAKRQGAGPLIDSRRRELGAIHVAKAQLGLDEETYRAMLWSVARVHSAADLDHAGRHAVLDHLRARGFKPSYGRGYYAPSNLQGRPRNINSEDRGPLLGKIEALLADAARPWAYVHGMARRMYRVSDCAFCNPGQLRGIVAALSYDQKRRRKRADEQ